MIVKTALILLIGLINLAISQKIPSGDGKSILEYRVSDNNGLWIEVSHGNEVKLRAQIGNGFNILASTCSLFQVFQIRWANDGKNDLVFNDCFNLDREEVSWYGGPETWTTEWPIEKLSFNNRPYISSRLHNGAVVEPYWLNSKGGFILVDDNVPLFVDQNNEQDDRVCFKAANAFPFTKPTIILSYTLAVKANAKDAHIYAVNKLLGKPSDLPDERMVREPIWTTWGKYKADVDDPTVLDYLHGIIAHNFTKGQIEIDDKWEECYGDQTFETSNSMDPSIRKYRCSVPVTEGFVNDYFVNSTTGNATTFWWNGNSSYVIDFTKPSAAEWFKRRLNKIQEDYKIDGFKCDAGESDWLPMNHTFHGKYDDTPRAFTRLYMNACNQLGKLVEVRSTWRTQELTVFVRMLDKDSVWGNRNGLRSLVHSLLQFNMIGYPYVLPDLVGGNGYNNTLPSPELLVRWTQANTFMPSIQFSFLPWELDDEGFDTTEIVRKFVDLHEKYSADIIDAMRQSVEAGIPTNPPIWWIDPTDPVALSVEDEFLLGEKILVAPILEEGALSRDVYLPNGRWQDGNTGAIIEGRRTLKDYPAPIDVLPYFIRL
ncbi:hypothetical protein WA026_006312 [Henosepilachna vigintioctopunctata]|uniref:Uncharacterized protein n=1 Tax=Henosepilachna vigintioctopunctata TaxID=420089 RepID=A0AAW1TP72_9CUCU